MNKRKRLKIALWTFVGLLVFVNYLAFMHSYAIMHFSKDQKATSVADLSFLGKTSAFFFGFSHQRAENQLIPIQNFEVVNLEYADKLEAWWVEADSAQACVLLFHGYASSKASLLAMANEFVEARYNVLMLDFYGSGSSDGTSCSLGYYEADQVKAAYDFCLKKGQKNIVLYGVSMGAVACMKFLAENKVEVKALLLEYPFASLHTAISNRLTNNGLPSFPMATLLTFWAGVQQGFWAFSLSPENYANEITCPTLLLYGLQDKKVTKEEIDLIYANLKGAKETVFFEQSGHEHFCSSENLKWKEKVFGFLQAQ